MRGKFDALCKEAISLKKSEPKKYQIYKLLGDAYLKPIVLNLIVSYFNDFSIDIEVEEEAKLVLENHNECAMPKFFDKYLSYAHDIAEPNEIGHLTGHAKADVVETLLELARNRGDGHAYMFIIQELFILVGKGRIVHA